MPSTPPIPDGLGRLGPWRILRRLGRGGVASVYEVVAPDSGQRVALKLFTDASAGRTLEREYRALAGLEHPGIVRVLGRGEACGHPYLLMELVVGRPAQACARWSGSPGSPARLALSLRVMHDLLEALAYLHRRGIVHRDVKSSNVLADTAGRVKLLDLGTAGSERRGEDGGSWVPGLDRFAGTVAYASPEQLRGEPVDGRSDLYSVGVLLYRMLVGELPFSAAGREQAVLARERAPQPPSERIPGIPIEASDLCMKLLAPGLEERPEDAEAALALLRPQLVHAGRRPGELWPEPAPLFGRRVAIETIEAFLDGPERGSLCVLEGEGGAGSLDLLAWVGRQARRGGRRVLAVDTSGDGPGPLISRLLLAVPRHLRRGVRRAGTDRGCTPRVARALALLRHLERGSKRPLLLLLPGLDGYQSGDLVELAQLMQRVVEDRVGVQALASRAAPVADDDPLAPPWSGLSRVPLPALEPVALGWHLRSLVGGRALPPAVLTGALREAAGSPARAAAFLDGCVSSGRLHPGRTPEGTACWLEALGGLEEPVAPPSERLSALLGRAADRAPWSGDEGVAPGAKGLGPAELIGNAAEDLPEPRVRAVLLAWRGHASSLAGDRDLQADADLIQAEEDLRLAAGGGWGGADRWREYVALVRAWHLAERGRQLEAWRRLEDAPTVARCTWARERREALRIALACAEGTAEPLAVEGSEPVGLELSAARCGLSLLRGRLREASDQGGGIPSGGDGWGAEAAVRLVSARARALSLRGELSRARRELEATALRLGPGLSGPAAARMALAQAELELELFRPGRARELLADCFVLLRHCDRPEIAAQRERVRGRVALACGEPARAEVAFRTGLNKLRGTGFHIPTAELQCQLARALARQGRRREAGALLGSARERLEAAGALPALVLACAASWEISGFRDDPQRSFEAVLPWLREEEALLASTTVALARLRHAALHQALGRVQRLRGDARSQLERLLEAQEPEERHILRMHPRMKLVRGARQSSTGAAASTSSILS